MKQEGETRIKLKVSIFFPSKCMQCFELKSLILPFGRKQSALAVINLGCIWAIT